MLINEILDRKVKYTILKDGDSQIKAQATINGRTIIFYGEETWHGIWEVAFGEKEEGDDDITYKKTGNGGELEVFSMVKELTLELVKKHSPRKITFQAAKDVKGNRGNLYARLIDRFKVPGYKIERKSGDKRDDFILTKEGQ